MKKIFFLTIVSITSFSLKGSHQNKLMHDIQSFHRHDTLTTYTYHGILPNGEIISANYFHSGPRCGEYYCTHTKEKDLWTTPLTRFETIPLIPYKEYFDMLKTEYEKMLK